MPQIEMDLLIQAPKERCFDLARSIDLHIHTQEAHGERAVAGVVEGLIGAGESVTWEARHFLVGFSMTSKITRFERPDLFRDEMTRGPFHSFRHDHLFVAQGNATLMTDICVFEAPLGFCGRVAHGPLTSHLTKLLRDRGETIRTAAETDDWKKYLKA